MLIILHEPTTADSPIPETDAAKREAAFNLARQLPYFDRSLTAYYLSSPNLARNELDLHVAHSILRLTPPSTTLQEFLTNHFPFWRTQGLLHVLALAAANMPSAERDWGLTPRGAEPVQTLLDAIAAARSPLEVARAVTVFQANAPSSSSSTDMAAFTETLDAIATIMHVKSNAPPGNATLHDLDYAITVHLPTPEQWTGQVDPQQLTSIWAIVKPALENALPPSMLLHGGECW